MLLTAISFGLFGQTVDFKLNSVSNTQVDKYRTELETIYDEVSDFKIFKIDYESLHQKVKQSGESFTLNLNFENNNYALDLMENDLRSADGFRTVLPTENGLEELPKGEVSWYKGFINEKTNTSARFSIRSDYFLGLIKDDSKNAFFEPASRYSKELPNDWVIFYDIDDVISKEEHVCGTDHNFQLTEDSAEETGSTAKNTEPCVVAKIALAADGAMVEKFGTVQVVENEMLDIFNIVEDRYMDPDINIEYEIVTIFISPTEAQDPWNYTQDFSDYLESFTTWGNSGGFGTTDYAVASLWTDKDFPAGSTSGAVGLAWVEQICANLRYNTNIHFTNNATQLIQVQTHEIGHNWSANHAPDNNSPNNVYIMAPSVGSLNDQWHPNSINSISNHKASRNCIEFGCENPPVADFTRDGSGFSCNGIINFNDQSQNSPDTWLWDFGDGNTSTDQNPTHAYSQNGTYSVSLTTTNQYGSDVATQNNLVQVQLLDPPTVQGDELCGPGEVSLSASGGGNLVWYSSETDFIVLHNGSSWTHGLNETTTYWVANETQVQEEYVGAEDNSIAGGAYFDNNDNWGLEFNAINDFVLKSVKVFSSEASSRTIQVLDNSNDIVFSGSFFIPTGESRVELNIDIPEGNGYLIKLTGQNLNLYRTDGGATYPYTAPGLVSITGNNTNTGTADDYYYYFFDWEVHEPICSSARIPVLANLNACLNTDIFEKDDAINVYPNPSSGIFNVNVSNNINPKEAYVINGLGQRVNNVNINLSTDNSEINLSKVSNGVYTLFIVDEHNVVYRKKLVKK